jgi:serine/threonine-protein kinase RIO1
MKSQEVTRIGAMFCNSMFVMDSVWFAHGDLHEYNVMTEKQSDGSYVPTIIDIGIVNLLEISQDLKDI